MLQLEPMPALERRWVHLALRDNDNVSTQSIGEEPNRRVVVLPRNRVVARSRGRGPCPPIRPRPAGGRPASSTRSIRARSRTANGDGVGDLPGVIDRLDHLAWLGVDAVWLSPIFRSPMRDFGYDVADYLDVDPLFGSLADADRLISEAHARGLRVLLDFVPNHTSSDHAWFVDARSSRDAEHRDWYVWRDPAPGRRAAKRPESAVRRPGVDARRGDGPVLVSLVPARSSRSSTGGTRPCARRCSTSCGPGSTRGIDGFRIDVLWMVAKDDAPWQDAPVGPARAGVGEGPAERARARRRPGDGARSSRRCARSPTSSRSGCSSARCTCRRARLVRYYGTEGRGAHLPFNFALVVAALGRDRRPARRSRAYEAALPEGAWPNWVLGNHDQSRVASRLGRPRRASRRCCCSRSAGRRRCTTATSSGLPDATVPPDRIVDVAGRDPERSPDAVDRGTTRTPASRRPSRGCRWSPRRRR